MPLVALGLLGGCRGGRDATGSAHGSGSAAAVAPPADDAGVSPGASPLEQAVKTIKARVADDGVPTPAPVTGPIIVELPTAPLGDATTEAMAQRLVDVLSKARVGLPGPPPPTQAP